MKNSWIIALRELKERVNKRSFLMLFLFGPAIVLTLVYLFFSFGGNSNQKWKVLIVDPKGVMENKVMSKQSDAIEYFFADNYIEAHTFAKGARFQQYDALVEINEKILSNKVGHVFYREKPSRKMQIAIQFQMERRLEEVMVEEFTDLSVQKFREIKQPIQFAFHNAYDPSNLSSEKESWIGFFFGSIIFLFIFLFGMTILRSVSQEKSNRVVEVLLASCSSTQLMAGKILGIGLAAFLQFAGWILLIGIGLYWMRENVFLDITDMSKFNFSELNIGVASQNDFFSSVEYNALVELVYERLDYGNTLGVFALFFVGGYLFYGAFFAALGAVLGSENDGQQFVLPLIFVLVFSLLTGLYALFYPDASLSDVFHYLPFTSPVVVMVKLQQGYAIGQAYEMYLSLLILLVSAALLLKIAGRLYKNGILQFGYRLQVRQILQWLKK